MTGLPLLLDAFRLLSTATSSISTSQKVAQMCERLGAFMV